MKRRRHAAEADFKQAKDRGAMKRRRRAAKADFKHSYLEGEEHVLRSDMNRYNITCT